MPLHCPSCGDELVDAVKVALTDRNRPYFYHILSCEDCEFEALTMTQANEKTRIKNETDLGR